MKDIECQVSSFKLIFIWHEFYKIFFYSILESALNQGVRTMAFEYRNEAIEFVLLHPGHVQTDMGTSNGIINYNLKKNKWIYFLYNRNRFEFRINNYYNLQILII